MGRMHLIREARVACYPGDTFVLRLDHLPRSNGEAREIAANLTACQGEAQLRRKAWSAVN